MSEEVDLLVNERENEASSLSVFGFIWNYLYLGIFCLTPFGLFGKKVFQFELVERRKFFNAKEWGNLLVFADFFPGSKSLKMICISSFLKFGSLGCIIACTFFMIPMSILMFVFSYVSKAFLSNLFSFYWDSTQAGLGAAAICFVVRRIYYASFSVKNKAFKINFVLVCCGSLCYQDRWYVWLVGFAWSALFSLVYLSIRREEVELKDVSNFSFLAHSLSKKIGVILMIVVFSVLALLTTFSYLYLDEIFLWQSQLFYRFGLLAFLELPFFTMTFSAFASVDRMMFITGYAFSEMIPTTAFQFSIFVAFLSSDNYSIISGIIALLCISIPPLVLMMSMIPFFKEENALVSIVYRMIPGFRSFSLAMGVVFCVNVFVLVINYNFYRIVVLIFSLSLIWIYESPSIIVGILSGSFGLILGIVLHFGMGFDL